MSNVKTVDRTTFEKLVESEDLASNMVEGYSFSVAQYLNSEGDLRAQAVYRPGKATYAVLEQTRP